MRVKKVEWKTLGRDMQFTKEITPTLSDGTVLQTAADQKPLFRGEDVVVIESRNVPKDLQYAGKGDGSYLDGLDPEGYTDNLEIVGLVSEFMHAQKHAQKHENFEEKVETRQI